jgi:hypothetical protein
MVVYSFIINKNKKLRSEAKCFQTWTSFFGILGKLPKTEYARYAEGFFLSLKKEMGMSLDLLVSVILNSPELRLCLQRSFYHLGPDNIINLLGRIEKMWPQEKDVVLRLKEIVQRNPTSFARSRSWFLNLTPDFINYLLTGRRTEIYIENASRRPISRKKLENILTFPLVKRKLNS